MYARIQSIEFKLQSIEVEKSLWSLQIFYCKKNYYWAKKCPVVGPKYKSLVKEMISFNFTPYYTIHSTKFTNIIHSWTLFQILLEIFSIFNIFNIATRPSISEENFWWTVLAMLAWKSMLACITLHGESM